MTLSFQSVTADMVERTGRECGLFRRRPHQQRAGTAAAVERAAGLLQRRGITDRAHGTADAQLAAKTAPNRRDDIVQVTSEAKASPIITAFTMMSAAMNMPHGDKSCGRVSSIAPAGDVAAGWPAGCVGAIVAGAAAIGVAGAGATGAGAGAATGATAAGAAGASATGAAPAGCSWAVALPPARITDATNAANKRVLDNSFFLVLTAASRFRHRIKSRHCT